MTILIDKTRRGFGMLIIFGVLAIGLGAPAVIIGIYHAGWFRTQHQEPQGMERP